MKEVAYVCTEQEATASEIAISAAAIQSEPIFSQLELSNNQNATK